MKNNKILFILILSLLIVSVSADPNYPRLTPYVNDFAGLLSPQEVNNLNLQCGIIREKTDVEIAIVTVNNTGGDSVIMYTNKLGDVNGVGDLNTNNGIILLYSDSDTAGFAIVPGRGEESIITDSRAHQYGMDALPYLNSGQYYEAFNVSLTDIQIAISEEPTPATTPQSGIETGLVILSLIVGLAIFRH